MGDGGSTDMGQWVLPVLVFGGLIATNAVVSLAVYWNNRTPLHRTLAVFWASCSISLLLQGAIPSAPASIFAFAFGTTLISFALVSFLRQTLSVRVHWRSYALSAAICTVVSVVLLAVSAPFWAIALPMAIAATFPMFDVIIAILRSPQKLSVSARCMVLAVVVAALHDLDYPFLRNETSFIPFGFAIAILSVFVWSISAPAMILERTAAEVRRLQAEAIERERLTALGEASAVVAHEVRNPLATMSNSIELLRKETLSDEGRELLSIQREEVDRLDRLVRDLLSFSKPLQPRLGEVELTALVREAVRSLRADAESARVDLAFSPDGEQFARGDPDTIHMALVNVLQNAIQASPGGGTVRIAVANGGPDVRVVVEDEGDGVPAETIERMFEPFFTTRATGSGLGLAILDRIMKAHGGRVRVTNRPEKGARFELVFSPSPHRP